MSVSLTVVVGDSVLIVIVLFCSGAPKPPAVPVAFGVHPRVSGSYAKVHTSDTNLTNRERLPSLNLRDF